MSKPKIGKRVKIISTGETGLIHGYAVMRGSGERVWLVTLDTPDKAGNAGAHVKYFDVEVIDPPPRRKQAVAVKEKG